MSFGHSVTGREVALFTIPGVERGQLSRPVLC
jgi:hypothetical protein